MRRRRKAARAPQDPRPAGHHARHRVVDAIGDLAVMHQRVSRDLAEPRARRVIVDDLRLLGDIAAGHHHRALHARQDQEMQRRRRQHEAEGRKTGRDFIRQLLGLVGREQHDRRRRADERPLLLRSDRAIAPDDVEIPRHQRERLRIAALQPAQARHGFGIGRVASEVKAAETLDRDDFALRDESADRIDIVERRMLVETRRRGRRGGPASPWDRRHGRRSLRRGNGGRRDCDIPPRTPRTSQTATSSYWRDRRGCP